MDRSSEDNATEKAVDIAAAAVFAAAVGFAAGTAGLDAAATISMAVAASLATFIALRKVSVGNRTYALAKFEPVPLELAPEAEDELVLDDRLGSVPPDGRIVRLFGPGPNRGPAAASMSAPPDASHALAEALLELRRSLR